MISPMRLKLVQAGEPVLREAARPLAEHELSTPEIARLIEDMRDTLRDAPGVGLAAPQVGVGIQLAIIEDRPEYTRDLSAEQLAERERMPVPFHVIVNPVLKPVGRQEVEFFEGCLSVNGYTAVVARHREVEVEFLDEHGKPRKIEARGWYARILQHEIDHLHGTLYVDRMHSRSFSSLENFTRHWKGKSTRAVLDASK
jgi:peptide deformylase